MKKLNLRIPALLLVVILIMAFAIPAFAANSSDAAAATTAVESAGGLSDTAAKALGAAIAIGLAAAGGAIAMGVVAGKSAEGIARQPEAAQEELALLNRLRERIVLAFEPLCGLFSGKKHTVAEQTYGLYEFITALDIEAQLKEKQFLLEQAEETEYNGVRRNQTRAQEYGQIYKIVMDLLDKVTSLLGEEQMTIREYGDILDAGFSAAKVGMIPPGNDRVTVGDIERTRLNHIRILFFVGVNDGIVPKAGSTGSIISQFEREKMAEHHLMLAPGARERVFIQKFYLYLNLTKPSDGLYVTYSRVSPEGKALRRSYLIGTLCNMFPELKIREPEEETEACRGVTACPWQLFYFWEPGLFLQAAFCG